MSEAPQKGTKQASSQAPSRKSEFKKPLKTPQESLYARIDFLEEKLLSTVGIGSKDYSKADLSLQGVHYLEFGRGNSPTVILVHGYAGSGVTFLRIIPELMKKFRVFAIDLPGFGKSDRPDYSFSDFESSMRYFSIPIITLLNLRKIETFVLVGHSYGGLICSQVAKLVPERVLGLFLVSAAGFTRRDFSPSEREQLLAQTARSYELAPELVRLFNFVAFDRKYPIFDFLSASFTDRYIEEYFQNKQFQLSKEQITLFCLYYQTVHRLPPLGLMSVFYILRPGAYCDHPIIEVLKELPSLPFFAYYGDQDWIDFLSAKTQLSDLGLESKLRIIDSTTHQIFFQNPAAFLIRFSADMGSILLA